MGIGRRVGCVAIATLALATSAHAATFTVDTTSDLGDAVPGDGVCQIDGTGCSLRAAVEEANALAGTDVVIVPAATYALGSVITVTSDIAITGSGARVTTVDASGADRAFDISANGNAVITGMTIQNGFANPSNGFFGGNIRNQGHLALDHVRLTDGSGYSGGAIANVNGSLSIASSLLDANNALNGGGDGGALLNYSNTDATTAATEIVNSTITGNIARLGGAINEWDDTGGSGPQLAIIGSTISGNSEGTGTSGGPRGGAGGISSAGPKPVVLQASIVQGNSTPVQGAPSDCGGVAGFNSAGYVFAPDQCRTVDATVTPGPGDSTADAKLGTLADNGGQTDTLAPLTGSPVIDVMQAPFCGEGIDQRDVARPQGDGCDAGAVEQAGPAHAGVPPSVDLTDAAIVEPDSGTADATVGVTLSHASASDVHLNYTTVDAEATAPGDYLSRAGVLTIPAGQTHATITVPIVGDTAAEDLERLFVDVTSADNPALATRATIFITDDDGFTPGVSVDDATLTEPVGGTTTGLVVLRLSRAVRRPVTVHVTTGDATATAGDDFTALDTDVTIPAGAASTTVPVRLLPDAPLEPADPALNAFYVRLSDARGGVITRDSALVTIAPPGSAPPPGAGDDKARDRPVVIPLGPGTQLVLLTGGRAGLPVSCTTFVLGCSGTLQLSLLLPGGLHVRAARAVRLRPQHFVLPPGGAKLVPVALPATARRALGRAHRVTLTATLTTQAGDGPVRVTTTTRTVSIRRAVTKKPKKKKH